MGSIIQGLLEKIFGWIWDWIIGPFGDLSSWKELIYGSKDAEVWATFSMEDITDIYVPGVNTMFIFVGVVILIGIILGGSRIASVGINPSNRTYVIGFFKDLLIVGILLFNLETIYSMLFSFNYFIINSTSNVSTENMGTLNEIFDSIKDHGILGALIIGLIMLGLSIWANFYYMMRKMTLLILMILGPLMIAFYLIPQTKNITSAWFKELTGTIFVQSIHAILFWMVTILSDNASIIGAVIIHVVFIPLSESIRSLIGLGGNMNSHLSKAGAMMGLTGLATVAGAIKGAIKGQSVKESVMGGVRNFKNAKNNNITSNHQEGDTSNLTALNNAGTDIGSTPNAGRMLKSGEIMSKGGKAVLGAAGAVAGMPLGPIESLALASLGSTAGSAVGGLGGRVGMTAINTAGKTGKNMKKGYKQGKEKFGQIYNAENTNDEYMAKEIADSWTTSWAEKNRDDFNDRWKDLSDQEKENLWQSTLEDLRAKNLHEARQWIRNIKGDKSAYANANQLINPAIDKLTETWANENKKDFFANYDKNNSHSDNLEGYDKTNNLSENREKAWKAKVEQKRKEIAKVVTDTAKELSLQTDLKNSFLSKEDFAKQIGANVSDILGKDSNDIEKVVTNITSSIPNASIYSGRTLNKNFMANRIATIHTAQAKEKFINNGLKTGKFKTAQEAEDYFNKNEAHTIFQKNLNQANQIIPSSLKLPHNVETNKLIRGASASLGFAETFLSNSFSLPEIKEKVSNSRIGALVIGAKNADTNKIKTGFQSAFKYYTPLNPIQKQAEFKNKLAYVIGAIGGVGAYKAAAKFASGGKNWENADGSFAFKWNPYNKYVQQQTSEIAEIENMVQKVAIYDDNGNISGYEIPDGSIRMATSRNETVIQVRNKAGQLQTVSRIGSGDSSLKKGKTIYQDLTISNGKLIPTSGVYREDSSGGKILLNRNIHVDPNKLVSNKATNVQMIKEAKPYNQLVDSNQYHFDNIIKDGIENIKMVIQRNQSYLIGTKDNVEYRISRFGPGDINLNPNQIVYQECKPVNRRLIVTNTYMESANGNQISHNNYSTNLDPSSLLPKKINKRNKLRKELEKNRQISFTEPLR